MAGFIRGLALIGVMAVYSPVHHGMDQPNWTESAASFASAAMLATSARAQDSSAQPADTAQSLTAQALADMAKAYGPEMARRLAEMDPEARKVLIDMTLAAAAKANAPAGEAKPKR
jgi:hypothetical protein